MTDVLDGDAAAVAAADGLRALKQLEADLAAAQDAPERAEKFSAFIGSDGVEGVAVALVVTPFDADRALLSVRGHLPVKRADQLEKLVRKRAAEMKAQQRQIRVAEPGERRPSVRAAIGAPEEWPDYAQPFGFGVSSRGVLKVVETEKGRIAHLVCDEPLMIVRRIVDVSTNLESLELGFRRDGAWRTHVAPRAQVRDTRGIVALSAHGLPVHSVNARAIVEYLAACESACGLTATRMTSRIGWHGDIYIAGPGGPIELFDPQRRRAGWRARGTYEGWLGALEYIADLPVVWALIYHGCSSILLRFVNPGHCPGLDLWGPSGKGKTSAEKAVASCWGYPALKFEDPETGLAGGGAIATSWDVTTYGLEELAAMISDAPLIIDDTNASALSVEDRNKVVAHACYQLPQGIGKHRGKSGGGLRDLFTWRNVWQSTSERPLISNTEAAGARNRVLSIGDTPVFPDRDRAMAFEAAIQQHHGHLAPRLAELALRLGAKALRPMYEAAVREWGASCPTADTRLLSIVALMDVTARVLHDELGLPRPTVDPFAPGGVIERALAESAKEANQADRALELLREDVARRPDAYHGTESCRVDVGRDDQGRPVRTGVLLPPPGGWRGAVKRDVVAVMPEVLRSVLRGAGHDVEPILKRWDTEGVLLRGEGKHMTRQVRIGENVVRMYVFPRTLILAPEQEEV